MNHAETTTGPRTAAPAVTDLDPRAGRLLSVAQLQQALRQLRADMPDLAQPAVTPTTAVTAAAEGVTAGDRAAVTPRFGSLSPSHAPPRSGNQGIKLVVRSAHSGAGSSTVAVAIADAAAEDGQVVQLVGLAPPADSGLVAVTGTELGTDATGQWLRGARATRGPRGPVTVDRLLSDGWDDEDSDDCPPLGLDAGLAAVTVVDAGQMVGPSCSLTVLVCRVSVPGLRAAERALPLLSGTTVLLAAVGAKRWPGAVNATAGPHVHRLQSQGRLVNVPVDHRLEVSGLTAGPLPKAVTSAGRQLLSLVLTHSAPGT